MGDAGRIYALAVVKVHVLLIYLVGLLSSQLTLSMIKHRANVVFHDPNAAQSALGREEAMVLLCGILVVVAELSLCAAEVGLRWRLNRVALHAAGVRRWGSTAAGVICERL